MDIQKELQAYADEGFSRNEIAQKVGKTRRWVDIRLKGFGIKTHAKTGPNRIRPKGQDKCEVCGKPNKRNASKYCSLQCCGQGKWIQTKKEIELSGKVADQRHGRRYFIERDGNKCSLCGNTVWIGQPIPLVLDHVDGNPNNCRLDNLRMICPNCDALTPTYKSKNRGNGRHARRLRYREGKSY